MNPPDVSAQQPDIEADLTIGPSALDAYSRLSYTMWHALAEFVDNSTQSRLNYERIVDEVLKAEGKPLQIDIIYNKVAREIRVEDNSIGMTRDTLIEALRIAFPTKDSQGRSKYGMGMKTAACWLGRKWRIVTCEWASGVEWTADVDVNAIAHHGARVPLTSRQVDKDAHYTKIIVSELRRNVQSRTEEAIRAYLGSMYMFDLKPRDEATVPVRITYNTVPITPPDESEWDTDTDGTPFFREIPPGTLIGGKSIGGWVGVLKRGGGGRKYGGFSLFQNSRQILGYPNAWKPRTIFGGIDDEGANNLVSQRLTGVLLLDSGFGVSHTKDAILFENDEEDQLENFLVEITKDYRQRALQRRGGASGPTWSGEKIRELIEGLKPEFMSTEMKDAISTAHLPPVDAIIANNKRRIEESSESEGVTTFSISQDLTIKVTIKEVSEYEPYVTIGLGADIGVIHVLINRLHPYYESLESAEAVEECITQFMYDAVAEHRAARLITSVVRPDSVRTLKDALLRAKIHRNANANYVVQRDAVDALQQDMALGT